MSDVLADFLRGFGKHTPFATAKIRPDSMPTGDYRPSRSLSLAGSVCYHTNKKKLKYRGKFRVQLWAVCRAAWINMKRIASYQAKQAEAIA